MEHAHHNTLEQLNTSLNDPETLRAYKEHYDDYKPSLFPRLLGNMLVFFGNVVYGRAPTYLKFRAIEVIARVPYHSWSSASYTHLTMFFTDERRALRYSKSIRFADIAQANETMHVVVISHLAQAEARAGILRHTLIPILFSFFYFWSSYILYFFHPKASYELNYLFESHAFQQYDEFLRVYEDVLRSKPIESSFLTHYGRTHANQYEFFRAVRNDEIIHRNTSIDVIQKL